MARQGDLILACMVHPQVVGSYFDRKRWPLHITLVPWFSSEQGGHGRLRVQLGQLAQTLPPMDLHIGDIGQLGSRQTTPVNFIANPEVIRPLHQGLVNLLGMIGLPIADRSHLGADFLPHITRYEYDYVTAGDRLPVRDFYLVELFKPDMCQILGRFELHGQTPQGQPGRQEGGNA